jgi:hypothetical protein
LPWTFCSINILTTSQEGDIIIYYCMLYYQILISPWLKNVWYLSWKFRITIFEFYSIVKIGFQLIRTFFKFVTWNLTVLVLYDEMRSQPKLRLAPTIPGFCNRHLTTWQLLQFVLLTQLWKSILLDNFIDFFFIKKIESQSL